MARKLRCLMGLHSWAERVQGEERYFECRYCGRYREPAAAILRYPRRG